MKTLEKTVPDVPRSEPHFSHESLDEALANHALEGLHPTAEGLSDLRKLASGDMTEDQFMEKLNHRYGRPV